MSFGMGDGMRRREFITLLGGSAATWPLAARAQERDRTQRIGVMFSSVEGDPQSAKDLAAFKSGLQALGWREGANLQIDYRWGGRRPWTCPVGRAGAGEPFTPGDHGKR